MADYNYPYTDFHRLNLDWLIEYVQKLTAGNLTKYDIMQALGDAADKVMFVTLSPCVACAAAIINAPGSFSAVYYLEEWKNDEGLRLLRKSGIKTEKIG